MSTAAYIPESRKNTSCSGRVAQILKQMETSSAITIVTKADQAYYRIKNAILRGEIAQGEKLVVHKLARLFSTSIIPVREAISRLEADDLVSVVAHTGIYVKGIDTDRLKELYPIRGILEGYAVRLAASRLSSSDLEELRKLVAQMDQAITTEDAALMGELNTHFHMAIYYQCGNQSLITLVRDLWQKTILARLIFKFTPQRAKVSNREHHQIVEALATGKFRRAETLIIHQSEKTLELLIRYLNKQADSPPGRQTE